MLYEYLKNKSVLVTGPPRSGKLLFAEQFLVEGFKENEPGIYIITNDFPESVVGKISKVHGIGNFHIESGMMKILDCYSSFIGVPKTESDTIRSVSGPQALNEIIIALSKLLSGNSRVVLDSATTLLLQNPFDMVEKFFQSLMGKVKFSGSTIFVLLDEGTHDERDIAVLESLTDVTVHFRQESENRFIEIKDSVVNKKISYETGTSGLVLKELVEA